MQDPPTQYAEMIPLQDLTYNTRLGMMMGTNSLKHQQTFLDTEPSAVTDHAVAKIRTMFPTVTETHIRTLLLKYLKNVFPIVEETILLDTLSSSDNNVHRATQTLETMGFDKRVSSPRVCLKKEDKTPANVVPHTSKAIFHHHSHSVEEKQQIKMRLKRKHSSIPERVISIALDSVDYDETRADQILNMMADEKHIGCNRQSAQCSDVMKEEANELILEELPQLKSPKSPSTAFCNKEDRLNVEMEHRYHTSSYTKQAVGPNSSLAKGPNQALLLLSYRPDYVAWVGSNVELACGPNSSLRCSASQARGPNPALCKGPNHSLAKGSLYTSQRNF